MFSYFSRHKCQYHKGQLAPFFIALIVIIAIAILITVNIGKVSLTKTYTANACDAGALAGATVMAALYEGLAETKEAMMEYWDAFSTTMFSDLFRAEAMREVQERRMDEAKEQALYALFALVMAQIFAMMWGQCEHNAASLTYAISTYGATYFLSKAMENLFLVKEDVPNVLKPMLEMIKANLDGHHSSMWENYDELRKNVDEAHENAIEVAYKLAFINSGIGGKLTDDQRDAFDDWLSDDSAPYTSGNYSWQDGQGRAHSVNVSVTINPIRTYVWVVTTLTYSALTDLFDDAIELCDELYEHVKEVYDDFYRAMTAIFAQVVAGIAEVGLCKAMNACCPDPACVACGFIMLAYSMTMAVWYFALVVAMGYIVYQLLTHIPDALEVLDDIQEDIQEITDGLNPRGDVANPGSDEVLCYLNAVPHSHRVSVTSSQFHQGKGYGFWRARYPTVGSSAVARFGGATNSLSELDYNAKLISAQ